MKNNSLILMLLLASSLTVQAATLAHESFVGYLHAQWSTSLNGGFGWGGSWDGDSNNNAMWIVADSGNLTYTGVTVSNGFGNCRGDSSYSSVPGTGANTIRHRDLDTSGTGNFADVLDGSLIGASGKTLWMGCVVHGEASDSNMHMQWRNGSTSVLELQATFDNADTVTLGATDSSVTASEDTDHFLLVKFVFGASDATVSFWLDPVIANGEGGLGTADAVETGVADFDNFYFEGGNDVDEGSGNKGRVRIDEIRFAEEFDGTYQNTTTSPSALGTAVIFR